MPPGHGTFQIDTGGFHPVKTPCLGRPRYLIYLSSGKKVGQGGSPHTPVVCKSCFIVKTNEMMLYCKSFEMDQRPAGGKSWYRPIQNSHMYVSRSSNELSNIMEGPCRRVKWATSHANPQAGEIQASSRPCTTCCNYIHMIHMIGW